MDLYETTYAMLVIQKQGGLGTGGLNFDAKVRRQSNNVDLFHAHVVAKDAFARGLLIAQNIIDDGVLESEKAERYSLGIAILVKVSLLAIAALML